MRRIALFLMIGLGLTSICGCKIPADYKGSCTINYVDGKVSQVVVYFPKPESSDTRAWTITKRDELDQLIAGLESLTADLKAARDRMPVVEPPPPQSPPEAAK